jgi:hypothetical protein
LSLAINIKIPLRKNSPPSLAGRGYFVYVDRLSSFISAVNNVGDLLQRTKIRERKDSLLFLDFQLCVKYQFKE